MCPPKYSVDILVRTLVILRITILKTIKKNSKEILKRLLKKFLRIIPQTPLCLYLLSIG
tara:strand:+ start:34015 stop:34191 length:177 start_codon:yes stop_codon:yes gene_type:complete